MSFLDELQKEPWRFDFFAVLRRIERSLGDRPRIGDGASRRDETFEADGVTWSFLLGQDPFLSFPASNMARLGRDNDRKRLRFISKFLGMLGPQGALPLPTTEEAYNYFIMNDEALPRFLDLFNHRFLELFYRAWADARPIVQSDHPTLDRFHAYVGSVIGIGSAPYRDLDTVSDLERAGFAGLLGPQARSASRLRGVLQGIFGVGVEIEQCVGSWLEFDPSERTLMGASNSRLGEDCLIGKASFSVQDKFRLRIFVEDMRSYERFLPDGSACERLVDIVFFYVGHDLDWELEIALPANLAPAVSLGQSGRLGWTSWLAPNFGDSKDYLTDARLHPADRIAEKRKVASR